VNFKINESEQKLRGAYYTPLDLAAFISRWVVEGGARSVLEPSCGDGNFAVALDKVTNGKQIQMLGIEIEPQEAAKARRRVSSLTSVSARILSTDFLSWAISRLPKEPEFDGVLGNPPFVRYQYLSAEAQAQAADIFSYCDLKFTKHSNAWIPFVIASIELLKPGGRLGMVVPAELLHVIHAQALRTYLVSKCSRIVIFDPEELWFDGVLQGALILLAEKKTRAQPFQGLSILPQRGTAFLARNPSDCMKGGVLKNGSATKGKWTYALLTSKELEIYNRARTTPGIHPFSGIASVDVGIVTGANKLFLVDDDTVSTYGLETYAHPMFGRSEHCPGVIYDARQHKENARRSFPTNFLWFDVDDVQDLTPEARRYVRLAEAEGIQERFKCRTREPWFRVPSVYATTIGMLKRSHDMPRLIRNELRAFTTDTAYRIRTTLTDEDTLVYCFLNSLTVLGAELEGRHYGGGVLELVPSEIERLLVPLPPKTRPDLRTLDALVRQTNAHQVLQVQDQQLLRVLGFANAEVATLQEAWIRLKNRRQRSTSETSLDLDHERTDAALVTK
jgi:adenine-specific DNA-methyltransferase